MTHSASTPQHIEPTTKKKAAPHPLIVHDLGLADYLPVWQKMREFTDTRDENTKDELWIVEHNPVFTQGQAGKAEHILDAKDIPIVQSDRGGQVTYHGPGQIMAYTLLDVRRLGLTVRDLVCRLERSVIQLLADHGIEARASREAPGVYVGDAKICSVGLRIRRGCCYHGLAFNVNMDLSPFQRINPCGYANLPMTQLADFVDSPDIATVKMALVSQLQQGIQQGVK